MLAETVVIRLEQLPLDELQPLLTESREQGFTFLDRLVTEYTNGANRFDQPGEALFGIYHRQQLIAIGGLNHDPYLQESGVGRVRHVYVLNAWRGQGVGRQLLQQIVAEAQGSYHLLTLRTFSEPAAKFYCAVDFVKEPAIQGATHHMDLSE